MRTIEAQGRLMAAAGNTPAPWRAEPWTCHAATTILVDDASIVTGKRIVAECESEEDARLIAAAPDLLEFAVFVMRGIEQGHIKAKQFLDFSDADAENLQPQTIGGLAQKVISKATGAA